MNNPITIIVQATGKIKKYHLSVESVTLMSLPFAWILFHNGCKSYNIFTAMTIVCLIAHFVRLICLKQVYPAFSIKSYIIAFIIPAMLITSIGAILYIYLHNDIIDNRNRFITEILILPIMLMTLVYIGGLNKIEKKTFITYTTKFLSSKCKRQR